MREWISHMDFHVALEFVHDFCIALETVHVLITLETIHTL